MTSVNAPDGEREVQELNLYFLLIKWSVHIWLCKRVRTMDATSLVQLMVKTVYSKQKHSLAQVISFWSQQRFPTQTGRKPIQ